MAPSLSARIASRTRGGISWPLLREMRAATNVPLAAQPAAFQTTNDCHSFTRLPAFPDNLETIQCRATSSLNSAEMARNEGIAYAGVAAAATPRTSKRSRKPEGRVESLR